MFDDILRELKRLERGVQVQIEMPLDDDGYFDRLCSHEECQREFKVLFQDWREKVSDEEVYCPFCGHKAPSTEWNTEDQNRYIKDYGLKHIKGRIDKAFADGARKFNRKQPSNGFITMKMEFKRGQLPAIVPCKFAELFQQKFSCEICGTKYSSIGASFFCPACGHNSVACDFDRAIETIFKTLNSLDAIKATLEEHHDKDVAEDTIRQILEASICKLTGTFQRLMHVLFNKLPQAVNIKQRRNVFQNLDESSDLWLQAGLKGYSEVLEQKEYQELKRLFQQRHLIAHCEGIVDHAYIDKSGDSQYAVGQRLVVKEESIKRLAKIVSKLADIKLDEVE